MIKVKIICDPYRKQIAYERWNGDNWVRVTSENNAYSKLVGEEFSSGFFPFKVNRIVDEIISAYHSNNETINIEFEGTEDDYQELIKVAEADAYKDKIECQRSALYLNNAREIVCEVSNIFSGLKELIEGSVEDKKTVEDDLTRYSEAANDMIPICVFGNVSSGKSSFINALIGNEILPSGDEPITAKVYKITKSEDQNRAFINLDYDDHNIQVLFDDYDHIETDLIDNPLVNGIKECLEASKGERVPVRVGAALAFINRYGIDGLENSEQDKVSDLIKLEVPYDEDGILKDSSNKYILFDTPGSNSASNEKHREVLKNSMKNLTNGLPVFVATSDTLDTEDNLKLYDEIRKFDDLVDSRFTMIVVNKADKAKLPKGGFGQEQIDDILREAIPRRMYSFGIYYVSSVMGLGAKIENDGDFVDDNYARIYSTERDNFSREGSRFYTQLFRYNILPGQMKDESIRVSEACENKIYSNSGMYWLEKSIEVFASNYSAYNKCQQSQRFLRRVLEQTRITIDDAKISREGHKALRNHELEEDQLQLIDLIDETITRLRREYEVAYPRYMEKHIIESGSGMTQVELKYLEQKFTEKKKEETGYLDKKIELEKSAKNFWDKFFVTNEDGQNIGDIERDIDKNAADELFERVKNQFSESIYNANKVLNVNSCQYWQEKGEDLKEKLVSLIMETSDFSDEKKQELSQMIALYQEIPFEDEAESIFLREDFDRYLISLGTIKLGETYRLNLARLGMRFNRKLKDYVDATYNKVSESHRASFINWSADILADICEHIRELNPTLKKLVEEIRLDTEKIADLEERQSRLEGYIEQIENLMEWKTK